MKKRLYLLIPVVVLLASGLFIIPVKAETRNDAENDVFTSSDPKASLNKKNI